MHRALIYIITGSLFAQTASPAFAQRHGGATGPRGGHVEHYGGARRGATTYHGPHGGSAARAYGPRGSMSGARGPYGGGASHVRSSYSSGGRHYYRPSWNTHQMYTFGRGFAGYPGWRAYHSYGLAPGLAAFSSLAFLSAGLLIGSYPHYGNTVYVYVVNEGGQNVEYRVDSAANILSARVLGPAY